MALIVDNPKYDAGLNEAIVTGLARPVRLAGDDKKAVGIQIVYGNVSKAVVQAEARDKPLLVYSWVPRAEIMEPDGRFVRITLETFYNCGGDLARPSDFKSSSSLAMVHQRGVTACDFPIENVEKAESWRLQEPKSTAASLFIKAFNLNPTQLDDLLKIGDGGWKESSNASAADLQGIACLWLNKNTKAWESWMVDVAQPDKVLARWIVWLSVCGLCFVVVFCWSWIFKHCCPKPEAISKESVPEKIDLNVLKLGNVVFGKSTMLVRKSEQVENELSKVELVIKTQVIDPSLSTCRKVTGLFNFLRWCLFKTCGFQASLCFALGQIFKQAIKGIFQVFLFERWLEDGLDHLNLQVTISCAVLMLTCKLIIWRVDLLDSGVEKVQEKLQDLLESLKNLSTEDKDKSSNPAKDKDLKSSHRLLSNYLSTNSLDVDQVEDEYLKSSLDVQFEQTIKSTASQLAKDCYLAAHLAFSNFFGYLFAVALLFYRAFLPGRSDISQLMIATFGIAIVWPLIVVAVSAKLKIPKAVLKVCYPKTTSHGNDKVKRKRKDRVACIPIGVDITGRHTTEWMLRGIMWLCIYFLWALGPALLNPLENHFSSGKNNVSQSDLLTVSTRVVYFYSSTVLWSIDHIRV